ncbi:hypothetical protein [Franconibacter pulveris]|uniref:Uncharacterized protein n=1 Tax=Franconibacter pulveris TaxID=435910 RepID=A0A0J8VLL6_9ENTR|nr:hypothetical protein [Franconibacter pulveris]KMV33922.1 hypothetical protein ACH50_14545 [Franconibacter pulveris]
MGALTVAVIALIIAVWHEINRFPATGKSIIAMQNEIDNLKNQNESLTSDIEQLKDEMLELSNQLNRMKDPEYCALLDASDGHGLYELEKSRGEI